MFIRSMSLIVRLTTLFLHLLFICWPFARQWNESQWLIYLFAFTSVCEIQLNPTKTKWTKLFLLIPNIHNWFFFSSDAHDKHRTIQHYSKGINRPDPQWSYVGNRQLFVSVYQMFHTPISISVKLFSIFGSWMYWLKFKIRYFIRLALSEFVHSRNQHI